MTASTWFRPLLIVFMLAGAGSEARADTKPAPTKEQNQVQQEYAPYKRAGTATLTGQAFVTTTRADVKYAAGRLVVLNPATSYTRDFWWTPALAGDDEPDPLAMRYAKTAIADAEGRFSFEALPAGSYFVLTDVSWVVDADGADWYVKKYGTTYVKVGAFVKVKRGEKKSVVLVPMAFHDASTGGSWRRTANAEEAR